MTRLDETAIRLHTSHAAIDQLANFDVLPEIDSTNNYLMQRRAPVPGKLSVAITSNQTAGRGRLGKNWLSPPGAGLCMSVAYTFEKPPENLSALTLAIGLAAIKALDELGAPGVQLKWPNDLVAADGKLGGILTEVQQPSGKTVTVVTGIGINMHFQDASASMELAGWAKQGIDLKAICPEVPTHEHVAGELLTEIRQAFVQYEHSGFTPFARRWPKHDWLNGREVTLEVGNKEVVGVACGIAEDGALLVDTTVCGLMNIASGSIVSVGPRCSTA